MTQRRRFALAILVVGVLLGCSAEQIRYQPIAALPQPPQGVSLTLYLVGDGGEVNPHREAVLARLRTDIDATTGAGASTPVVVAFLGDNIYDTGARLERLAEDVAKLEGQVLAIGTAPNVRGVFVPGNHDWANGASFIDGRDAIARQRDWVASMTETHDISFMPDDGCPGPVSEDVGGVHLVFLDSEWLLRETQDLCGSDGDFYARLANDLREHRDRPVVLLAHHPLASGGPHGGNVSLFERGPVIYYLAMKSGVSRQDLRSPAYTAMRRGIATAIRESEAPPLIHAAGHDHTLQVIRLAGSDQPRYQLVSGSLSKTDPVGRIEGTRYATDGFGYMRLQFVGREVHLAVFARSADGGPVQPVFACILSQAADAQECPEAPLTADGA
jgi:hypothetical protein